MMSQLLLQGAPVGPDHFGKRAKYAQYADAWQKAPQHQRPWQQPHSATGQHSDAHNGSTAHASHHNQAPANRANGYNPLHMAPQHSQPGAHADMHGPQNGHMSAVEEASTAEAVKKQAVAAEMEALKWKIAAQLHAKEEEKVCIWVTASPTTTCCQQPMPSSVLPIG